MPSSSLMPSTLEVAALSDMGCVRKNNEDNFGYDAANGVYVVCDGMGGMAAGEVASAIAVSTAINVFCAQPEDTPPHTRLALAIRSANDAVRVKSHEDGHHGMGTTLVSAVVQGSKLLVGNVGDSRAYLFQNGASMQLTVDHSYINELVRNGTVKVEDIHSVNLKGMESVITRAIGASNEVEPDFFSVDLKPNDTLLLTSDGLTRYVDSARLTSLVDPADLDASCQRLIQAAKDAGGADNITCLLLRFRSPSENGAESLAEVAPIAAAPFEPALVQASPFDSAPLQAPPVQPAPVDATVVGPAQVDPALHEAAPEAASPLEAAPVEPASDPSPAADASTAEAANAEAFTAETSASDPDAYPSSDTEAAEPAAQAPASDSLASASSGFEPVPASR